MRVINRSFVKRYSIDLTEAEKPLDDYTSLQELFSRKLRLGIREIPTSHDVVISPCDGRLSQIGKIEKGHLIQAKGREYPLDEFLGDESLSKLFIDGYFATLYLSPRDYHRFHVPVDGEITKTLYVKGTLWPVNDWAVSNINNLFCQNERFISLIQRDEGFIAHVAIGATMVGKIHLNYCSFPREKKHGFIPHEKIKIAKGDELGQFLFGSTIVLLFQEGIVDSFNLSAPRHVKVGDILAKLHHARHSRP